MSRFTIPHTPHYMSILSNRGISHTDIFVFWFFPSITDCVMYHVSLKMYADEYVTGYWNKVFFFFFFFFKQQWVTIVNSWQNKCREHTYLLLCYHKLITVFVIVKVQTAMFMYKAFNTMLPINLLAYFSRILAENECVTRQKNAFKQLYARSKKKHQCVSLVGFTKRNNIDNYVT